MSGPRALKVLHTHTPAVAWSRVGAAGVLACWPSLRPSMSGPGPKRETVVDLAKFIDKGVLVKLSGGREGTCARARARCTPTVGERGVPQSEPCVGAVADAVQCPAA